MSTDEPMYTGELLRRLNKATRHWHADADEPWLQLLRPDVTKPAYVEQLVRMYGFEAALEGACQYTPHLALAIESRHFRRAGLLAQDVLALGVTPVELARVPQCFAITPFKDVPEAMGWLYVVERTTLLHDQIRRHLVQRVPEAAHACAYFSMFDAAGAGPWQAFGRTLDRFTAASRQVVDAANTGFECMVRWFRAGALHIRSSA
jgi:heme oxygenase